MGNTGLYIMQNNKSEDLGGKNFKGERIKVKKI